MCVWYVAVKEIEALCHGEISTRKNIRSYLGDEKGGKKKNSRIRKLKTLETEL